MKNRDTTFFGILLILVAVAYFLNTFNIIDSGISSIIFSRPMLIFVIGTLFMLRHHRIIGAFIMWLGLYLLIPRFIIDFDITSIEASSLRGCIIGLVFLSMGLIIIFKRDKIGSGIFDLHDKLHNIKEVNGDGVLNLNTMFGGATHVVLERPFKGANISSVFSGLKLDLRNTTLEDGDTYISVKCIFGGIEVIVPSEWCVVSEVSAIFGGVDDKRDKRVSSKSAPKRLILTGGVIFGGTEIQSEPSDFYDYTIRKDESYSESNNEVIDSITVKHNNKVHIIPIDELQYIQADGDYVTLCSLQGKFLKEQTMKYYETVLPEDKFIRIHRSYIVKLSEISYVDTKGREIYFVVLKDGTSLRASTSGYQQLKQRLSI